MSTNTSGNKGAILFGIGIAGFIICIGISTVSANTGTDPEELGLFWLGILGLPFNWILAATGWISVYNKEKLTPHEAWGWFLLVSSGILLLLFLSILLPNWNLDYSEDILLGSLALGIPTFTIFIGTCLICFGRKVRKHGS